MLCGKSIWPIFLIIFEIYIVCIMRTNVTDNKLLTNKIRPLFLQADFSKCELFNFMHAFVCIDTQYTAIVVDDLMIGIAEKC